MLCEQRHDDYGSCSKEGFETDCDLHGGSAPNRDLYSQSTYTVGFRKILLPNHIGLTSKRILAAPMISDHLAFGRRRDDEETVLAKRCQMLVTFVFQGVSGVLGAFGLPNFTHKMTDEQFKFQKGFTFLDESIKK